MKLALAVIIALASFASIDAGYQKIPVQKNVTVLDVDGLPLQGIEVWISYLTLFEQERAVRESGLTDENGIVAFEGQGYREVSIYIEEVGYYRHRVKVPIIEYRKGAPVSVDEEVTLTIKSIRNPITMVADGYFALTIPEYNKPIGYDFFANDWVAPYGAGKEADANFTVSGYYNSSTDNESKLIVEFPREGDGLVPFKAKLKEGSALKSGYSAPLDGYTKRLTKSRMTKDEVNNDGSNMLIEFDEDVGYYFRIRTVLDENGKVVEAYYGKIYGDFAFDGVWPRESAIVARAYYINPNVNDRNVEAVPGETLIPNLGGLDEPKLP